MMKKIFLLTTFTFAILSVNAQSNTTDEGVVINGVKWATRNVDAPGTFAANAESSGMFYQWNRQVGWSTTDPVVNSNGGNTFDWDSSVPAGITWEKANDPSPSGWRVPTSAEIQSLLDTNKVVTELTTQNGITVRKFTDLETGNSLFFPAAGYRTIRGALQAPATIGYYWSSTQSNTNSSNAFFWSYGSVGARLDNNYERTRGLLVRAVSESSVNSIINVEVREEKTPVAYYSIMGVQLQKEPQSGIYIIVYNNGTKEKIMRKP